MPTDYRRLSRTIAHALRHAPWLYELELDDEGWVPVDDLLDALRRHRREWHNLTVDDLQAMMATADKQRYELREGRIRAYYGHSTPHRLARTPAEPPTLLYHGTSDALLDAIRETGLKPMNRQYIHLSADVDTAQQVGQRKSGRTVVLIIRAEAAHAEGVPFYHGNEMVWLADSIPARYIIFPDIA